MKHEMNKISKYYQGPDGVFYDYKHDEIFELEYCGAKIYRRNVGIIGRYYRHITSLTDVHKAKANTAFVGFKYVIRLGDL